jgi:hypothetical protein
MDDLFGSVVTLLEINGKIIFYLVCAVIFSLFFPASGSESGFSRSYRGSKVNLRDFWLWRLTPVFL